MGINKTGSVRITKHGRAFVQPLLLWKSNKYYMFGVCVCSLRYPACNAYVPYCHLWPIWIYLIFSHFLIHGKIFEEKSYWTYNVLIFSATFVWNSFRSKKNWAKYDQKCKLVFILVTFQWNLNFYRQSLENYSSTKYHENPSSWSRVVPCWRRDGQTDMTKLIGAFRNFANAPKNKHNLFHTIYILSFNKQQISPAV
jgi:hypothetical protein